MTQGLIVVGGGPAGHRAAMAYREAGGVGPVRLLSADQHPPYNRPPLTKDHLRGESEESDLLLAEESDYVDRDIEVRLGSRVVEIDPARHTLVLEGGEPLEYAACIWAAGSRPVSLPVPGADHPGVLRLRSLAQGRRLRAAASRARTAIVIGSGFIGCEAAASLALRGLEVTLVSSESSPQADRLGAEVSKRIAGWLRQLGVELVLDSDVEAIDALDRGHRVRVSGGPGHRADLVLQAAGIQPCSEVLEGAGVALESDRVVVDQHMRSSVPDLYAAGDVAIAYNPTAARRLSVEHWGEALAMGSVAGTSAAGGEASWDAVPGFWSEIGEHTIKYAAWGDGYDQARLVDHGEGAFTVWYTADDQCVGVLTHEADDDYDRGSELVASHAPASDG